MSLPEGLQRAVEHLARETVRHNWDPGRMVAFLLAAVELRRTWWPTLTAEEKASVLAELERMRDDAQRRLNARGYKAKRYRSDNTASETGSE